MKTNDKGKRLGNRRFSRQQIEQYEEVSTVQPSQHLKNLRAKASDFLASEPKDIVDLVFQEQREAEQNTRYLLESLQILYEKKSGDIDEVVRLRKQMEQFNEQMQAFKGKVEVWHGRQQERGYGEETRTEGARFIEEVKRLEEKRKAFQHTYEGLHDFLRAERLHRQNQALKQRAREPQLSKADLLSKQIASVKQQYREKLAYLSLKKTEAKMKVTACHEKFEELWSIFDQLRAKGGQTSAQMMQAYSSHAKTMLDEYVRHAAQCEREEALLSQFYTKILAAFDAKQDKSSSQDNPLPNFVRISSTKSSPL